MDPSVAAWAALPNPEPENTDPETVECILSGLQRKKARISQVYLYDDAGIAQMCQFRKGLMEDEPTWVDYCHKVDDPNADPSSGEAPKVCSKGTDVMSMFYGDADYDIDQIDLAVFATDKFDEIAAGAAHCKPAAAGPTVVVSTPAPWHRRVHC